MGLSLVLAGTGEDGQGAYTEALPGRNLSTATVDIIATANFDNLHRVGTDGDVEVGHVEMVVFSSGRTFLSSVECRRRGGPSLVAEAALRHSFAFL